MKRLSIAVTLLLASVAPALAQNGSGYTVDNFDFANGVRILIAEAKPAPPRSSR